jgi:hypothetical protein
MPILPLSENKNTLMDARLTKLKLPNDNISERSEISYSDFSKVHVIYTLFHLILRMARKLIIKNLDGVHISQT